MFQQPSPSYRRDWEPTFATWARPPGTVEQQRCDNAIRAVKEAIAKSPALNRRTIDVFAQGSYANRVNVKKDSDVDVCVLCSDTFLYDLPLGVQDWQMGFLPPGYGYDEFKNDVGFALGARFGNPSITLGDKAFKIHANTYRIDADVVPCFEYRRYFINQIGQMQYQPGTALFPGSTASLTTNFPRQQYDNGVAKNKATGEQYKALVRIIKSLRNEMDDAGIPAAKNIPSFLIESLVWNWHHDLFNQPSHRSRVVAFIAHIWGGTNSPAECSWWMEANGIKSLFGPHNVWSPFQIHDFALAAYQYIASR